jgi:RNA polymerase sigma-70 factor (ECF subfamily)
MSAESAVSSSTVAAASEHPADLVGRLFDAHHERLYRLARRLASGRDEAQDLVQDTFLRAAKHPRRVPAGHCHEEAWLVRVLVNLSRDRWRRAAVRRRGERLLEGGATAATASHESAAVARAAVWPALDRLHPRRRAVVVLHEIEGETVRAIASLLGISAITVRWHLSRGRRELARLLGPDSGGLR